jgi:hypothetical protein
VDQGLDELPLPPYVTAEDEEFAVRALRRHAPHPAADGGLRCRHDGAAHPCRLYSWGHRVLLARGHTDAEITALIGDRA